MLIKNIIGTITIISFINNLLTLSIPFSKLFFSFTLYNDFAILPKYVLLPVAIITASALPLITLVPVNPILDNSVNSASSFFKLTNYSTGLDSTVKDA